MYSPFIHFPQMGTHYAKESIVPGLYLMECNFDTNVFDDKLYKQFKIDFPSKLIHAVPSRRAEYLAGRVCALATLRKLGITGYQVPSNPDHCPIWPFGVHGSISHSENIAIAAATSNQIDGIGIDIQPISKLVSAYELHTIIFTGTDWSLRPGDNNCDETLPLVVLSIKESFFKAAYQLVRCFFDFSSVEILSINWNLNIFVLRIREHLHEYLPAGREISGFVNVHHGAIFTLLVLNTNRLT